MANIEPSACMCCHSKVDFVVTAVPFYAVRVSEWKEGRATSMCVCVCVCIYRHNGDTFNSLDLFVSFPFRATFLLLLLPPATRRSNKDDECLETVIFLSFSCWLISSTTFVRFRSFADRVAKRIAPSFGSVVCELFSDDLRSTAVDENSRQFVAQIDSDERRSPNLY